MAARKRKPHRRRARRSPATKVSVRRRRRRSTSRGGFAGGLGLRGLKGFINKDLLTGAGGVTAIAILGPLVLNKLRGLSTTDPTTGIPTPRLKFLMYTDASAPDYKGAAVLAGVGILAAMLSKKFYPKLAVPLAIGGIGSAGAMIATQFMNIQKAKQLAATAAAATQGQTASPGAPGTSGLLGYEPESYGDGVNGYVPDNVMVRG